MAEGTNKHGEAATTDHELDLIAVDYSAVPEALREKAGEMVRELTGAPGFSDDLREAIKRAIAGDAPVMIPLGRLGGSDSEAYPECTDTTTLIELVGLDYPGDLDDPDGLARGLVAQQEEIAKAIDAMTIPTLRQKMDLYSYATRVRTLIVNYNECWHVVHQQLTQLHDYITDKESAADGEGVHEVCYSRSPVEIDPASLAMLWSQMSINVLQAYSIISFIHSVGEDIKNAGLAMNRIAHERAQNEAGASPAVETTPATGGGDAPEFVSG